MDVNIPLPSCVISMNIFVELYKLVVPSQVNYHFQNV